MVSLVQPFVNLSTPMVDKNGVLTSYWQQFFQALWTRTGSAEGASTSDALTLATAAFALASAALAKVQNLNDLPNKATARTNLGLHALATALPVAGWIDPTGTGSRATFDMDWTQAISVAYVQAEVVALRDQIVVIQKRLGQVILDDKTIGTKS